MTQQFVDRVDRREAVIAVVGLGYVGLPLLLRCCEAGFTTIGVDTDPAKLDQLRQGRSYIRHIADARVQAQKARMSLTGDFADTAAADAILICVPTPLTHNREPDLRFVLATAEALMPHLRAGQLVSLESTTYPGTTREELGTRIESRGFTVGRDVHLVFSPEREDPGNPNFDTRTIPKVVGGLTLDCTTAGAALYAAIVDTVVPVSNAETAELTKLMENIHRAVNIGLVNELKVAADAMGIDIHEVIAAAATKPFGFVAYSPGPGIGGHCIPIDPYYLTWKAREYGVHTRFIELAGEINDAMPDWVMHKLMDGLNARRKPLNGSRILVLGVAYKKHIDDLRQSPALVLMEKIRAGGGELLYSDPYVPRIPSLRDHSFDLASTPLTEAVLRDVDGVLIATDHDDFDYDLIQRHASLIIDTRGRYRGRYPNVVMA